MDSNELAKLIRKDTLIMTHDGGAGHIGSILSIADIIAVLYGSVMNIYPSSPMDDRRDRFILSKGHAGASVYAALAELGYFDKAILGTYYKSGSSLSGHVSHKNVAGVEFSSGSLGLGIGVAVGMALAGKIDNKKHHVYVIVGDGECNEGSVWEAAMFASQNKLGNLTVIIDCNKLQAMGKTENIINMDNMEQRWQAFGFKTISVDGHDHQALKLALNYRDSKPVCIIAKTIKGKGVSFMENNIKWHYGTVNDEELAIALKEVEEAK